MLAGGAESTEMVTRDEAASRFAKAQGIDRERIGRDHASAIYFFESLWEETETSASHRANALVRQPTWGLIHEMIRRSRSHIAATLSLSTTGQIAAAEALARSCVEASVNSMWVMQRDSTLRLKSYFDSYIEEETRQLRLWKEAVVGLDGTAREIHDAEIRQKDRALALYSRFLHSFYKQLKIPTGLKTPFPSIFQRFKDLGDEIGYRTVYMAMCSQAHNDAEDLLNALCIKSRDDAALREALDRENRYFSEYLVFLSLDSHFEEIRSYCRAFGFSEAAVFASVARREAQRLAMAAAIRSRGAEASEAAG